MIYANLFWDFFKVSCFTFGGAYGAIPLIREMVLANGWIDDTRLTHMIAISESTPGPIIVNLATYIGSDQAGLLGSVISTVGVVLPAYLVILLIMAVLKNSISHPCVQAVLRGLKPCVVGIVLGTGCYMVGRNLYPGAVDGKAALITALLTAAIWLWPKWTKTKLSPITLICLSAVLGMIVYSL